MKYFNISKVTNQNIKTRDIFRKEIKIFTRRVISRIFALFFCTFIHITKYDEIINAMARGHTEKVSDDFVKENILYSCLTVSLQIDLPTCQKASKCLHVPELEPGILGSPFRCPIHSNTKSSPDRLGDIFSFFFMLPDADLEPHWPPNVTGREKCIAVPGLESETLGLSFQRSTDLAIRPPLSHFPPP